MSQAFSAHDPDRPGLPWGRGPRRLSVHLGQRRQDSAFFVEVVRDIGVIRGERAQTDPRRVISRLRAPTQTLACAPVVTHAERVSQS